MNHILSVGSTETGQTNPHTLQDHHPPTQPNRTTPSTVSQRKNYVNQS